MAKRQDIDTLKAWVHWVSLNPVSEDQAELARAVNDVISQVGTWKAKYEALKATLSPPIGSGSISWDAAGKMVSKNDYDAECSIHGRFKSRPNDDGCRLCDEYVARKESQDDNKGEK